MLIMLTPLRPSRSPVNWRGSSGMAVWRGGCGGGSMVVAGAGQQNLNTPDTLTRRLLSPSHPAAMIEEEEDEEKEEEGKDGRKAIKILP